MAGKRKKEPEKVNRWLWIAVAFAGVSLVAYWLVAGWMPEGLARQNHDTSGSGEYDAAEIKGEFLGQRVEAVAVRPMLEEEGKQAVVLGESDEPVEKKIEVDLGKQMLYAKENGQVVAEFQVSTGKWGRTPTGSFRIWTKLVSTKMEGGSKALRTYYYLPNVPYTMFFYNESVPMSRGYGIHGAYWHSNFGETMSHGCINMRIRDAEKLFYWAGPEMGGKTRMNASKDNPGTEIEIYGKAN